MGLIKLRRPARLRAKLEAAICLCLVAAGFALPKRVLLRRWTDHALARDTGKPEDIQQAYLLARDVGAVARRLPRKARCLQRSLALSWMLRRRGMNSRLRFGVRNGEQGIQAHAWIEIAGEPVNDSRDRCAVFTVLQGTERLPDAAVMAEDAA
ncbi:MAG TPA: lasso peptide biosynthesis B2 protein [Dehalococcoidia bacterium]|nr:lasso peptide biosynthesis B2 protein [Dehalococcoidia bacterium]